MLWLSKMANIAVMLSKGQGMLKKWKKKSYFKWRECWH